LVFVIDSILRGENIVFQVLTCYPQGEKMPAALYRKFLMLFSAFVLGAALLNAAYLHDMPMTLYQPDGTKIECFASGDEYHNWLHDKNNYTIIRDPQTGYLCYAEPDGQNVKAGRLVVGSGDPHAAGLSAGINISEAAYKELRRSKFAAPAERDAPTTGTINNVVIFIRFSGESEFGQNISVYDGWFNSSTNSQKNYYLEASYNQLTVNTNFFPAPQSSMVVSWQDSHARAYFQPYNATTNPTGYNGDDDRRNREFTLLQNAIAGVASQVPTGLNIDSDGDGRADNVVFLVSGSAGEWSSLLWPHRWAIYDRTVYLNGKRVYDFNLQLQDFLASRGVGVICHEFFHTLGAPDLYHYTSNGIDPAGSWDLMCSDQNPPQHMTAFMKWKYGDWISSVPTIYLGQQYTLNPLASSTGNCFRINSNNASQYYMVEFRKKTGTFESSVPGSGLLIYRIDTSAGDGNADGPPDEFYVYRPNGTTTVNGTISSAYFSQESGRTSISNTTNPAPFLSDGSAGNLNLYSIGSAAGTTLTFSLGVPTIDFSVNPSPQEFDDASFPPSGWINPVVSGTYLFERVTSGTNPTVSPQSGAGMVCYKSYSAASGSAALLASPRLTCNEIESFSYGFSFYMYRDTGYNTRADRIELYLSTLPDMSGTNTLLGTINRYTGYEPIVATAGWYQYSYSLPLPSSGYYYIVFKAISVYGNNMFLDSFSVRKTLLPPPAALSLLPANNAVSVSVSPSFTWSSGGGYPSYYLLYLGTNNPPTNILNGQNIGNVLTYSYTGTLSYLTQYYWQIMPANDSGTASDCPVWSFTTCSDPRIAALPYSQNFDAWVAPTLPYGWTAYVSSSSVNAAVRNLQSPNSYAVSPPNCMLLTNSTDTAADLRLVSPEILVPMSILRLKFSARGLSTGFSLQVGTMNSPSGTFTSLGTFNLTNVMQTITVSLAGYSGSDSFIAIKHGLGGASRSIYIDDLSLEELLSNDLAVSSVQTQGLGTPGVPLDFSVEITNNGVQTQSSYRIQLLSSSRTILSSLDVAEALLPGASAVHVLSWTPTVQQTLNVYAHVILNNDSYSANNVSVPAPVSVGSYVPEVGDPQTTTKTNYLPLNFNQKNSISETIYLASELQMSAGSVTAIAYQSNFVQSLAGQAVKIWMKNTADTNLSSGWQSFAGYTLVFDGQVNFPSGANTIVIALQSPFPYTGNNLALRLNRPADTYNYNSNNQFYCQSVTDTPNRSRYLASSTTTYDPTNPSAAGTLSSYVPVTGFAVIDYVPAVLATPSVATSLVQQGVQLSWNAVPGANRYRIYASPDPTVWQDTPLAEQNQTSYTLTNPGNRMFFKVIAVYLAP